MIIELTSADLSADPRLDDYTRLKDVKLRSKIEPEHGLYMAESANVIERAIQAGHQPRSFLMSARWLESLTPLTSAPRDPATALTSRSLWPRKTSWNT